MLHQEFERKTPECKDGVNEFLLAIFFQTIEDYLSGKKLAIEDVAGRNGKGIFSFPALCEYFRLDQAVVRKKLASITLKAWKKACHEYGFRTRSCSKKVMTKKICPTCGHSFSGENKFCSTSCIRKQFVRRNVKRNKKSLTFGQLAVGRKRASDAERYI